MRVVNNESFKVRMKTQFKPECTVATIIFYSSSSAVWFVKNVLRVVNVVCCCCSKTE